MGRRTVTDCKQFLSPRVGHFRGFRRDVRAWYNRDFCDQARTTRQRGDEYSNFSLYQGRLLRNEGKIRVLGRGVVPRVKTAVSCNQWPACVAGLVTMSDGET